MRSHPPKKINLFTTFTLQFSSTQLPVPFAIQAPSPSTSPAENPVPVACRADKSKPWIINQSSPNQSIPNLKPLKTLKKPRGKSSTDIVKEWPKSPCLLAWYQTRFLGFRGTGNWDWESREPVLYKLHFISSLFFCLFRSVFFFIFIVTFLLLPTSFSHVLFPP